jgi:hypothetical protein
MKKLLTLVLISTIGIQVFAQIEKGSVIIISGTDLAMSFGNSIFENNGSNTGDSKSRNISVAFAAGAFVADNFAVGIEVPIKNSYLEVDNDVEEQSTYGIMPFFRAYLSHSGFNPYMKLGLGYVHISYLTGIFSGSLYDGLMIEGGVGFTAFISEKVAIDSQFLYDYSGMKNSEASSLKLKMKAFGIQIGFSIVL